MEKKYWWIPPAASLDTVDLQQLSLPSSCPLHPLLSQLLQVLTDILVSLVASPDLRSHW